MRTPSPGSLTLAGANVAAKDNTGKTAADWALENHHPMVFAMLEPVFAKELGEKLKAAFVKAAIVHVISTRFQAAKGHEFKGDGTSANPNYIAARVKTELEKLDGTLAFNPNYDNAFLMAGNSNNSNAIWLRNWRKVGLENAQKTGGACVQVVTLPDLSEMQRVEADMAADKGVRVVKLDCTVYQGGRSQHSSSCRSGSRCSRPARERFRPPATSCSSWLCDF